MKKHLLLLCLLLLGSIGLAVAQSRQVQGVVKAADGETLPGVTVLVEGTTNGASTGPNGDFSITLPANSSNVSLRFSYVGYVSQAVKVGDKATINVTLVADSKQLDDVVVIGFQEVQRRDVTGSVASVNAQQIKDVPVNSAAEALAGRLAGVQVTSSEGQPGSSVQVRVRGGGSITQDNSPLYVVDGVQVENALAVLSPQDIASVDVLKDASATAIYGARGANGVVIITTKGGKEGRTTVTYNGFAGFRRIVKTLPVLQSADYVDYAYEKSRISGGSSLSAFKNRFGSTTFRDQRPYSSTVPGYDTLGVSRNADFINWQDRVFGGDAFQQTHNISVAGGAKGTTYSLSLTRNDENGIQLNTGFVRNLVNFRLDHKANDKFRVGFSSRLTDQVITGGGTTGSTTASTTSTRLRNSLVYLPIVTSQQLNAGIPVDDYPDDEFFSASNSLSNPILTINNETRKNRSRVFNLSGNASYNFTKNLSFRSTLGFDYTTARLEDFYGQYSPAVRTQSGLPYISINTGQAVTLNNSNVLSYTLKFGKNTFDGVVGEETYQRRNPFLNVTSYYLPKAIGFDRAVDNIGQRDPSAPTTPQLGPQTGVTEDSHLLSGFGRLNYNYDGKYLFTATFRADGSSKFKGSNKVGYFPAASAAWRFSQEKFMEPFAATITDAKLRLSYGLSGNNRINDFLYDPLFGTSGPLNPIPNTYYALNDNLTPGIAATSLANPNLKWETTASTNVGLDLGLFNNRVQFTADAYYNRTSDLLLNLSINPSSGYTTQLINIGSTSNRGLELQLTGTVIKTPDFSWSANTNFSFNRNRVEDLGGSAALPIQYSGWASTAITGDYYVAVGQPVGLMYGYVTDFDNGSKGFYTADDFKGYNTATNQWILKDGVKSDKGITGFSSGEVTPGTIKLKDINGDGVIDTNDRQVIGNANPKFTGGLNQQFSYKGFDASIFLNWVVGNDIYNANKIELTSYLANGNLANGLAIMKDRYRQIDENGAIITDVATSARVNQNASIWSPTRQLFLHSWAIEDGSFLRINNVTMGYTLPRSISQYARLQSARFYVTLNNIYTFTKYTGFDPEVNTRRSTSLTPGVDYAAYPRSRAFLFGMNLTF
ncbi:SusC/RagA family TonB-linked outer membrane protein [Hymenobacter artigasi]|uniref:TonB-linked SusC/RagA family outer membrane protein n=1 Tax=Hymenobacter artigasi TaxID=2719616 RepID=A0ABX1HEH6_9BACT|nr:TonB-dependent receptor [Hymenobacter artigasi]NKI87472.1 TonB-linked SusC/RagA family outer membrane protein [Hymenobacter artigasi]